MGAVRKDPYPQRVDLTAPRVPADAVLRSRLTDTLHTIPLVTVVRAPGGSGKTVLASQLVSGRDLHGAWITIDQESSTRDGFWRALLPRVVGPDLALMYLGAGESPTRQAIVEALRAAGDVVVVVDDAHLIAGDAEVAADIIEIARSTRARFLVLTRTPVGALEDASTRLSLDVAVVTADDLAFTESEVGELAGPDVSAELLTASGGHALLLRALVLDDGPSPSEPGALVTELISGFLDELDFDKRHFLLRTSLAGDFTMAEAEALVGPGDHAATVADVERRGLVMRYRSGTDETFRYHPVVRDVLVARLEKQVPADLPKLHRIIARARADRGELIDSFHHALLARDYPLAADVFIRGGTVMLRSGGGEAAMTIPLRVAMSYPVLAMARGLTENARGHHWAAREYFAAALVAGRSKTQRNPAERATLAVGQSVINRISGKPADAARLARTALELIERAGPESFGPQLTELYATCAVSFYQAESWDEASRVLENVPVTSPRSGLTSASVQAAIAARQGDWDAVADLRSQIDEAGWPATSIDTYPGVLLHFAEMLRALVKGDATTLRERLDLWSPRTSLEFRGTVLSVGYLVHVLEGAPDRAIRSLVELREFERSRGRLSDEVSRTIALAEAVARVAAGEFAVAERLVARLKGPWASALRAQIGLLQHDDAKAVRALADPDLVGSTDLRVTAARHLLLAWRSLRQGDEASAARILAGMSRPGEAAVIRDVAVMMPAATLRQLHDAVPPSEKALRAALATATTSPFGERASRPVLTDREIAVVLALRGGETNAEVAQALNISRNTLKAQLRSAYLKLGVTNREDALARVSELGLQRRPEN
jgi:LuxR family maltose regulon positive regulatory protein